MKYRALRDGYIGGHYVFAGETFTYNGKKPSWAECLGVERKSDISDPSDSSDESDVSDEARDQQ